ncbi:hypothetical protein JCM19232_2654 [Vibrio ishigakensis]|uniref:Uncharacterized protein n=1 Tax=Vibrio ishigakensis TaxID=1481914 RepID=A0A0B8PLU8_9VIBR|nr:hypothetical protein JCM19232_2654 [Vibrio ishigakensis]
MGNNLVRDNGTPIQGFAPNVFYPSSFMGSDFSVVSGVVWMPSTDVLFGYDDQGQDFPIAGGTILVIPQGVSVLNVKGDANIAFAGQVTV